MNTLRFSGQFKKDFKRFRKYPEKVDVLNKILRYLMNGEDIPKEYRPRKLTGNIRDVWSVMWNRIIS